MSTEKNQTYDKRFDAPVGGVEGRSVTPFDDATANARQVGGHHYKGVEYQHWDLCWDLALGHLPSAITKYVTRHPKKLGRQDLEKALHYAEKYQEVISETEMPFPRVWREYRDAGNYEAKYSPDVAAQVQEMVSRYNKANGLQGLEAEIIATLCHPHSSSAVYRVQEMIRELLVQRYPEPRYEPTHEGEDADALRGYVNQDRPVGAQPHVARFHDTGARIEG